MGENHENDDKSIEIWKIKKLMKSLEASRGNETIIISLIIPPHDQISEITKLLDNEYETASNRMNNQQSILAAITSAQQRLKLYSKIPSNGLVLYTGTIVTQDKKKKKFTIDFEPPLRPMNASSSSLYLCDNKFHSESLNQVFEFDEKFGFIVMDTHGTLFGTLNGNTREVLGGFPMNPDDLNRARPLSLRFLHRMKKYPDYMTKTVELATKYFINPSTNQPNVSGLILAACEGFKTALSRLQISMLDPRLRAKIVNLVDVSIGGEMGFIKAIEVSSGMRANVKLNQEKLVIEKYFEAIRQKRGKYVFGVDKTVNELETGAIETLIVWEDLEINRYVLKNSRSGEVVIRHSKKEEENIDNIKGNNKELVVEDKMCLVEWLANEYRRFGFCLQIVTNKTQQGFEFCTSFDGIGAILCYPLEN